MSAGVGNVMDIPRVSKSTRKKDKTRERDSKKWNVWWKPGGAMLPPILVGLWRSPSSVWCRHACVLQGQGRCRTTYHGFEWGMQSLLQRCERHPYKNKMSFIESDESDQKKRHTCWQCTNTLLPLRSVLSMWLHTASRWGFRSAVDWSRMSMR